MPGVTVKDVCPHAFVTAFADYLKQSGKIEVCNYVFVFTFVQVFVRAFALFQRRMLCVGIVCTSIDGACLHFSQGGPYSDVL